MSIFEDLAKHLDPDTVGTIAGKLGIDPEKAKGAVASALPTIVGALAKNSQTPDGAQKLDAALGKDHDGSLLEQLGAAAPKLAEHGQKILAHVLGDKKEAAAGDVAKSSGLPVEDAAAIVATLAPIVMGVIGKKKKEGNLDAAGVASALAPHMPTRGLFGAFEVGAATASSDPGGDAVSALTTPSKP